MEVLYPACAGIDVHKKNVVACRIISGPGGKPQSETRTFSTMTKSLLELSDWLNEVEITHVAMESTGDFWKPIYNILEGNFELWVVNAHHVKAVPGRKTDVKDAQWLADLMRHGLLRPSFVPKQEQREWRDLTRMRLTLVRERASFTNRMHKALESANIKLGAVATDLLGTSSRHMLRELATNPNATPEQLADMALGRLQNKRDDLTLALQGRMNAHHRFVIAQLLDHIEELDKRILAFETRIEELNAPFRAAVALVDSIPGMSTTGASALLAEIGVDMSRFPTSSHLASWLGLCPGNNQSGGKTLSGHIRKGNVYARVCLVQIAHRASMMRTTQYYALYRRIAARRGKKKALIAVAHALIRTVFALLKAGALYQEPAGENVVKQDQERLLRSLARRAQKLGHTLVPMTPEPVAA